jgi:hypothetical protein
VLVNELVIGSDTKDLWKPTEVQHEAQFLTFYTNPAFPELVEILFPGAPAVKLDATREALVAWLWATIFPTRDAGARGVRLRLSAPWGGYA